MKIADVDHMSSNIELEVKILDEMARAHDRIKVNGAPFNIVASVYKIGDDSGRISLAVTSTSEVMDHVFIDHPSYPYLKEGNYVCLKHVRACVWKGTMMIVLDPWSKVIKIDEFPLPGKMESLPNLSNIPFTAL